MVNELYVSKNKYFEKADKAKNVFLQLFGNSILFDKSNELWATKRKHLSSAFYKDKMTGMLQLIIATSSKRIEEWKEKHIKSGT